MDDGKAAGSLGDEGAGTAEEAPARAWHVIDRERLARMFEQAPGFMALLGGPDHVFELTNAAYRQLIGHRDVLGRPVAEALPEVVGQGFIDLLDRVRATGEPFVGRDVPIALQPAPGAPVGERVLDFLYQPITDDAGQVTGIFVEGSDVTERARADRARRASETRYRQIVEGAEDFAIVALDDRGTIADWNSGAEKILGWARDEAVGRPGATFFTPEDVAASIPDREMSQAAAGGRAVDERWHVRRDGTRFWGSGLMMRLDGGGYLKVFHDRTAEHEAEASLRATEARYRTLFEAVESGFCVVEVRQGAPDGGGDENRDANPDGGGRVDYRVVEANPAFYAQTGFPEAILGQWLREAVPTLEEQWYETYGRVARTGEPARFEQGSEALGRWFDVTAFRVGEPGVGGSGADGLEAVRVAILFNDISARRRAELALEALNRDLEARVAERTAERDRVWQVSRDLLGVADERGVWLSVNPAWSHVLGWDASEILGRTSEWMEHPDDRARTRAEVGHLAAGEPTLAFENRFRARDGTFRDLSWTAVPVEGRLYCAGRDVTAEKEQAAALALAEEALRQSQKMEAVGQLTGGLAHDFNNLLAGIQGSLELMGTRIAQGRTADVDRYMLAAQAAAKRAAALTHRLLAFSRRQTLAPKVTDANALVAGMEDLIGRTVGPAVAVRSVLAPDLWAVEVDPHQLENSLLNLAINARDAMPDGGAITVETANRPLDARAAEARDLPPGQYVSVCVSDTGAGMTAEVAARAFEPFFTTKPIGVGTGLGLSMIYGFARQSGGQVRLHSQVGQGTTVRLYLPRHLGEPEAAEAAGGAPTAALATAGETVLVVDDEALVRMLVVDVLEEGGYAALEAGDGAEALRVLRSPQRVDLLVTDVGLPGGLNGRQVADAARALRPGLPVLFVTGYAENAVLNHGHLDQGMQVVTKPFGMEELGRRIRAMLSGE